MQPKWEPKRLETYQKERDAQAYKVIYRKRVMKPKWQNNQYRPLRWK